MMESAVGVRHRLLLPFRRLKLRLRGRRTRVLQLFRNSSHAARELSGPSWVGY
jgi:hypothetical protein